MGKGDVMEKLLSLVRTAIANINEFDYEEIYEVDEGKFYDIRAKVDLIGTYYREGKIKVISWLKDTMLHTDVYEYALDKIEDIIMNKLEENGLPAEAEDLMEIHFLEEDEIKEIEIR